ncbi:hypothetical protein Taro_027582 [Colocasia esculenta]|uniref:Aminotransferase-like plant mobile domain-containing protein n=1 Tax=Colocasia esculenta TaxID=4460 RepID=A0A843V933_COLES|nr:hypothetical protein [Colocasia esculenta]
MAEMDQLPGPIDTSETEVLKCWEHYRSLGGWPVDPRIVDYVYRAGLFHLTQVQWIRLNWALITALAERWRSETQTFHLRHGEMSITLQDVDILMGLPIDGDAVVGNTSLDWTDICMALLGDVPELMRRGSVKSSWLRERFAVIPEDASVEMWHRQRDYIIPPDEDTLYTVGRVEYISWYWSITKRFIGRPGFNYDMRYEPRDHIERSLVEEVGNGNADFGVGITNADSTAMPPPMLASTPASHSPNFQRGNLVTILGNIF